MTAPNDTGTNRKARVAPGRQSQPSVPARRRSARSRQIHSDPAGAGAIRQVIGPIVDVYFESDFYVVGTIDEALEKAKSLAEE